MTFLASVCVPRRLVSFLQAIYLLDCPPNNLPPIGEEDVTVSHLKSVSDEPWVRIRGLT